MRPIMKICAFLLSVALLAILLRIFVVGTYSVPFEGLEDTLYKGERILVNKWNYGRVGRGDLIVFRDPSDTESKKVLIGRVMALPGDIIYMDHDFHFSPNVNLNDTLPTQPIYIPLKGVEIPVKPWSITLLSNTLNLHEHQQAEVMKDGLQVNGKPVKAWTFTKNYYWVMVDNESKLSDSRLFGFVPQDLLIGKATRIWLPKKWSRLWKKVQ